MEVKPMKSWLLFGTFLTFPFLFVQGTDRGSVWAESWTPEQKSLVNQAVDRYLDEKGVPLAGSSAIDFSEVSAWGGSRQAFSDVEVHGKLATAFGVIKVRATGTYSRGFPTQLRFFHLLNLDTDDRMRIDVKSASKALVLTLVPGKYEVIRVQLTEGPFTMESHVNWQFEVQPNGLTYLGTWEFEVESPRTQRKVRVEISSEPSTRDRILEVNQKLRDEPLVASLPHPLKHESQLFGVAPVQGGSKYFRRR